MSTTAVLNSRHYATSHRPARARLAVRERAYRRALRAAEMAAWNAADPRAITRPASAETREDRTLNGLFFVLFGAGAAALLLGATASGDWAGHWQDFVVFVREAMG